MKKYKTDCLFINEWREMEGTFYACSNKHNYPNTKEVTDTFFPNCNDCPFYTTTSEVRRWVEEIQEQNINELYAKID